MSPSQGPQPTHRPRPKKRRKGIATTASAFGGAIVIDGTTGREKPAFPLAALLWPARASTSSWVLLPITLMVCGLFRWATALWPYSGQHHPHSSPWYSTAKDVSQLHGDFEAQRHWLELTTNLPVTHWYFHDLEWWGLDYPPLTAYHSWVLGKVGGFVQKVFVSSYTQDANTSGWYAMYLSRGLDDPALKVYMRATVVASEYLVYVPALVLCCRQLAGASAHSIQSTNALSISTWSTFIALTAVLLQPATILVDHGHFQYNTVMLGLFLASLSSLLASRHKMACIWFVASLGFKQMALFFAPAIGAYLAGSSLFDGSGRLRLNLGRFAGLAVVTVASFGALYAPMMLGTAYDVWRGIALPSDAHLPPLLAILPAYLSDETAWFRPYLVQLLQSVHRIFPFSRGLFEDKVANLWCALHTSGIHRLTPYSPSLLSKGALGLTIFAITPPCLILLLRPRRDLLVLATSTCAWAFFLCGFQVHEKNVLLPLLPMTLLLATQLGMKAETRAWIGFANTLAAWTLFPLLAKDELRVPYWVLSELWSYLLGLPPYSLDLYSRPKGPQHSTEDTGVEAIGVLSLLTTMLHLGFYAARYVWHAGEWFVDPMALPAWIPGSVAKVVGGKPDLWVVVNACLGAAGFGLCYLWCFWRLVVESEVLEDIGLLKRPAAEVAKKVQ